MEFLSDQTLNRWITLIVFGWIANHAWMNPLVASQKGAKHSEILNLYDRVLEPVFIPKGDDNVIFDAPPEYLDEHYQNNAPDLANRFGGTESTRISVNSIKLPDLTVPLQLGRREPFSLFIPRHRQMAARLVDVLIGMRSFEDFKSAAVFCQARMNPFLFIYGLSVAILHRPDTKHLPVPQLVDTFPEKYMDGGIFTRAREQTFVQDAEARIPLEIPRDYTASDLDPEHRVAYFREDLGINLHHWHWHLVYPFSGNDSIINKDRRGELFYYMHQQMVSRYNFERLSNRMPRVKRFLNWREPIEEGYFPKLDSLVSSRVWAGRNANTRISDIDREIDQLKFDIEDLERWRDRIYEAIHTGNVINNRGQAMQLTIDILGNMLEASDLSPNRNLYGDLHNLMHVAISYAHDPDHKHLETFTVMGDSSTAMRDPAFYRWHSTVDDIFQEFKGTQPPYPVSQLNYSGIEVKSVQIIPQGRNMKENEFTTFWRQSDVDMSRGLDFQPRGSVFARFTHLMHSPFSFRIMVDNNNNGQRIGTVRIFLAPKFDERGLPMLFRDQKQLFIELDKFQVTLRNRQNVIERRSSESSVTIPFTRTFRNLDSNRPNDALGQQQFNFCGCGWPEHMLIPKGHESGLPCQLFVMVSNFADDRVEQDNSGACADAASFCGIRDKLYPDKRSMGYPFDRRPRSGVETLAQFVTPNMFVQDVTIKFTERTETPGQNSNEGRPNQGIRRRP